MRKNLIVGNIEIMGEDISDLLTLNQALEVAKKLGDGWRLPMRIEEVNYFQQLHVLGVFGFKPEEAYWAGMGRQMDPLDPIVVEGWSWWIDDKSVGWDRTSAPNRLRVRLVRDIDENL